MDRPLAVVTRPVGVKVQRVHRVQRGRYRHWNRSAVQVQRVQKVQKVQRGRYRPAGDEYVCCLAAAKTVQPGLRPVGNAPLFPSGGGAVGRRGAFPRAIGAVVWFSLARKGGCKGFIHNGGAAAYQPPLNLLHLLNLLNPHARKGVSITPVSRALPSPCRRGIHSGGNRFRSPVSLRGIPAFRAR